MDIRSKKLTATGALGGAGRTRIKALNFAPVAAAGNILIKDGNSTILDLDVASGSTTNVILPGDGILSQADPTITLTTVASLTVFFS